MTNVGRGSLYAIGIIMLLFSLFTMRCTTINQSETGLKIAKFGDDKGSIQSLTPGMYVYNNIWTKMETFPNSNVTYPFTASSIEGSDANEEFVVTTKDNIRISFDVALELFVPVNTAANVYRIYKKPIEDIVKVNYRNKMRDIFNAYIAQKNYDELSSNLNDFRNVTGLNVKKALAKDGVNVVAVNFLSEMRPPEGLQKAILNKNIATQDAQRKNRELEGTKADSAKAVVRASADARVNELKQKTLTPAVLEEMRINAWDRNGAKVPGQLTIIGDSKAVNWCLPMNR